MWILLLSICVMGYLFGSVPFGYLAGRVRKLDIRQHGSHNIGATNVLRVLGKKWGAIVFLADAAKGFGAVWTAYVIARVVGGGGGYKEIYGILAAAACVIGHAFPIWLNFKGGKGVATSAGAIFGIMPIAAVAIFLVWLLVFQSTRYVSAASISAACALPIVVAILVHLKLTQGFVLFYFSLAMAALVVWRHRSNLSRLLAGTEQRFTRR